MTNYGDYQLQTYFDGLSGKLPELPMTSTEMARRAEEVLSPELWSYVSGGAGDERTQNANVEAFDRWGLMPRMLVGAGQRDHSITLFGREYPTAIFLAPVGVIGLCDPEGHGDLATARAAAATGVPMVASTLMMDPLEDVAAEFGDIPGFFQLYPPNDRELTESFVRRAEAAGYAGIVITLDTWTLGYRPRDLHLGSFPQLKGLCLENYFSDPLFRAKLSVPPEEDPLAAALQWAMLFGNPGLNWEELAWIRGLTTLPILLKGICDVGDVERAKDAGVEGIYCSTHGGRQANGGLPALDVLPEVVEAAGDLPVLFDSGIRTGADIVKALALGATAVGIGRPYAYGLAVGGQAGIEHTLRCLLAEADLTMAIDGYPSISSLTRDSIRRVL